jgi:hypothetical protein
MTLRSRRASVVLALCVAATDTVLLWPAAADAPVATGSWQVLRQGTPLGETPSTRNPGDHTLPVQNGPAGVLAFAALRYDTAGATGGTLTLSFAGQPPANPPTVDLCPTTSTWKNGLDQPWGARPGYDCTHAVVGAGNPSQMTWEVGAELLGSGRLDVVLVPAPDDRTPYDVSFAAPDAGSFEPSSSVAAVPAGPVRDSGRRRVPALRRPASGRQRPCPMPGRCPPRATTPVNHPCSQRVRVPARPPQHRRHNPSLRRVARHLEPPAPVRWRPSR